MSHVFMFEAAAVAQVTAVTLAAIGLMGVFYRQAAMRHAIGASGLLLVLASPLLALAWPRPFWLPSSDPAPEGLHDATIRTMALGRHGSTPAIVLILAIELLAARRPYLGRNVSAVSALDAQPLTRPMILRNTSGSYPTMNAKTETVPANCTY